MFHYLSSVIASTALAAAAFIPFLGPALHNNMSTSSITDGRPPIGEQMHPVFDHGPATTTRDQFDGPSQEGSSTPGIHPGTGGRPVMDGDHHMGSTTDMREMPPMMGHADRMASSTSSATAIACVGLAVSAREQSLDSAIATYGTSLTSAYTSRASALASAYAGTSADTVRSGVKNAWSSFNTAMMSARKAWKTAQMGAWNIFKTAAKACGGPATSLADTSGASLDMSGQ